jgi:hypothetical protein
MAKRYRIRMPKPNTLESYYGKAEDGNVDVCFAHGPGCEKADARLVYSVLATKQCRPAWPTDKEWDTPFPHVWEPSFLDELDARGYDLTTLKFSIKKKA